MMDAGGRSENRSRLVRAGLGAWSMLGVVGVVLAAWWLCTRLSVVVVPVVLALFVAAALAPIVDLLYRLRTPRPLASLIAVLVALAVVAVVVWLVVPAFLARIPELGSALARSTKQLDAALARQTFLGSNVDIRAIVQQAASQFFGKGSIPAALGTVVSVLTAIVLMLVVVLFYLAEGRWLAAALVGWLPEHRQREVWDLAVRLWEIVGRYFRALLVVALFDAVFIGLGLMLLNVPLALPLAVLVYFGAFLPYIGAVVSGMLAVLVALAERGPIVALLVLGVVLLVQQLEGNVIQPVVMGRIVRLPAFVVLLVIAIGGTLLGVLGAFLAVPVAACAEALLKHLSRRSGNHYDPPGTGFATGR
ncbi:putative PurR-regulated permease PerM [Saccharopolyspora lacisalsi]|uniref:Putative PurR-regulated permease PerM n=1 Tax=Halosaccharopolyspora lacisalsi TaxID=1000566 RepID=A0A839DVN4_9PSEU|nr:AI-2E family transporter [Halosaccharopolyspora lacisalsi]MBA8824829.1 putative PurR-regulated permease PerM [Halosaccharopolyspora lacisalsi]